MKNRATGLVEAAALVVEPRYVIDLVTGITHDGLVVGRG